MSTRPNKTGFSEPRDGASVARSEATGAGSLIWNVRKTRSEIRKTELEAASLAAKMGDEKAIASGYKISILNSDHDSITIMADPRLLGPLLLLLDFVIAWVVLTFARYPIGFFLSGPFYTVVLATIAAILLIPILREARRLRAVLRPPENNMAESSSQEDRPPGPHTT